jgi:type I restriction enzyme M protein
MVRLSKVNMYLHQFKTPNIYEYNTLAQEERWNDKFDIILANPPFMTPKGGMKTHSRFSIQATKSEVLFVDYIMDHLRPKGRAGIIVPEGIIFQSGIAYKQLRKKLVEDGLWAVVSLPSGVFNPYAGVKTSILLFDNERAKQTSEILFVKIESDGYDLGAQRRPIQKNDLPEALRVLTEWKDGKKAESRLVLYVERTKIAETGEYNLTSDRYRESRNYDNAKWKILLLKELEDSGDITLGRGQVISKKDIDANPGIYPVYSSSAQGNGEFGQYGNYMFDEELITWSVDGGGRFFYRPKHKFSVTNVSGWLRINRPEKINAKYLYRVLDIEWQEKSFDYVAKAHPSVIREMYHIPLPPLEVQEQIVVELDEYQKIISGAKQIVENWKPTIDIDPTWQTKRIEELCTLVRGSSPRPQGDPKYYGGDVPRLMVSDLTRDGMYVTPRIDFLTVEGAKLSRPMKKGDVVMAVSGNPGLPAILEIDACIHDGFVGLRELDNSVLAEFMYYMLVYQKERNKSLSTGAVFKNLNTSQIINFEIPVPPVEIQKYTIEKIEAERALVESSKKLIYLYEKRTKEVITKLWSE